MKAPRNSILYIDDDLENRISFHALLRRDYPIFLAEDIDKAKDLLKVLSIETVLCDYHLTGVYGLEFFSWLQTTNPSSTRILVSGSTVLEDKEAAKESGLIHDWIAKPWEPQKLKERLKEYFSIRPESTNFNKPTTNPQDE